MPPVDEWASDTNYSPPASIGVSQATKIAPSAGAIAQGIIPGLPFAAQRLNWILNALCVLANDNEGGIADLVAALDLHTLQAAYDRSVAEGETAPHIALAGATFIIGGTASGTLLTVNGTTGKVSLLSGVDVEGGLNINDGDLDVGGGAGGITAAGDITGASVDLSGTANVGGLLTAEGNAQFDGDVNIDSNFTVTKDNVIFAASGGGLADGAWTPSVSSVSGTGVVSGDFTSLTGHFIQLGKTLFFTIDMVVDTTGWSGACTVEFDPPVGTVSGNARGTTTLENPGAATTFSLLKLGTGLAVNMTPGASTGPGQGIHVSGSVTLA